MLDAAIKYGTDMVRFTMGPDASWHEEKIVREENGLLIQFDRRTGVREGVYDIMGGGSFIPDEKPLLVLTVADVDTIAVRTASEYRELGCLTHVQQAVDNAHARGLFVIGMISGGQTVNFMVTELGGTETALFTFYDNPALALALIDKAIAISIERGKAFIEAGVDCLYFGDSYASASVISPDIYERFCAPAYREVASEFHRSGVFCYKHCCGRYMPLIEYLPATGIDAMDGIDPESGNVLAEVKKKIGAEVSLMGGMSCLTYLNGTPEAVYEEASHCIMDAKAGGRFALGSGCAIPRHTPAENIAAARKAIVDQGVYG
jgi:uroporphyrinogen-III decarboxylase